MAVSESMTVTVNAPIDQVLAFLRDIDNQSTWFPGNTASEVLERDDEGRPSKARLVNDVKVAKDEFVLDYTHNDTGFSWHLARPPGCRRPRRAPGCWSTRAPGPRRPCR